MPAQDFDHFVFGIARPTYHSDGSTEEAVERELTRREKLHQPKLRNKRGTPIVIGTVNPGCVSRRVGWPCFVSARSPMNKPST